MIKADVHVHTNFSPDSKIEVCDHIEKAMELGFHSICITDHYDIIYLHEKIEGDQFVFLNPDDYFKCINNVKEKYREKIDVLTGIEMGLLSHLKSPIYNFLNKYDFDFVIGSSHFVGNIEPYQSVFWENRSEKEAIRSYFESILENVKIFSNYDVYAHLDYVVRYAPNKCDAFSFNDHQEVLEEILKNIIKNGKGIEINTGGLRDFLGYPNPHKDILKMYKSFGGDIITVGSDAHASGYLGYEFKIVKDLMKEIGFKYYAVYKNRMPQFFKV